MKSFLLGAILTLTAFLLFPTSARAQKKKLPDQIRPPQLVRTTMKQEQRRFSYGGSVTLVGAPEGSITIEGWNRTEVTISAEIQLRADTEQDLDRLAAVNGVVLDEDANHIRILSTGTHDKAYMKTAKKFPKALLGLPWKIDYRIRVPAATDLDINAGRGPIRIVGVEGDVRISAAESETDLKLSGGALSVTVAKGKVNLTVPERSWRRGGADIRVAIGDVSLGLPPGFNGDVDAEILRSGQIIDSYGLEVREKPGITQQNAKARAGSGGASFQLTVADGTINITKQAVDSKP
jgi:hypothetical protein